MKKIIILSAIAIVLLGAVYSARKTVSAPVTDNTSATTTGTPTGGTSIVPKEGTITLKLGETAAFEGLLMTPLLVTEDSRCPANVNCVWAGTVILKLELRSGLGSAAQNVKLGEFVTTEAQKITFISVSPQKTTTSIDPKDYRFTLKVERSTPNAPIGKCYVGGCSSEVCSDQPDMASNCIYKPEFACYKNAKCERQSSGQCGWTPSTSLTQCLNNAAE